MVSNTAKVIEAAAQRLVREGHGFGRKAFISDVKVAVSPRMSWQAWSELLLGLHAGGEIELARADLVPAMDQATVDASEVALVIDGRTAATFHFVVAVRK